jgi:HEXXH motif-containing protein
MQWRPEPDVLARDNAVLLEGMRRIVAPHAATLHPYFFQWAYDAQDAGPDCRDDVRTRADAVDAAIRVSRARAEDNRAAFGLAIDVSADPELLGTTIGRMRAMAAVANSRPSRIDVLTEPGDLVRSNLASACDIIHRWWPEMFTELGHTTQAFFFFAGETAIGASDIRSHGAIFLRTEHAQHVVTLAEEMIHEASHTRLNAAMARRKMFTNPWDEHFQTPLRADRRPMFGLFHQMFVLARLAEYYRRLPPELADAAGRQAKIEAQLAESVRTVGAHARFTPVGQSIYQSVAQSVAGTAAWRAAS